MWFLSEEFNQLREGFIPDGKSKYDDKRVKAAIEEESVKKNTPHTLQKKLFVDGQIIGSQQTKWSQLVQTPLTLTQFPMLPLLHPILYLPLIEQQTSAIQRLEEELPITIEDFNNSNNQDTLCDSPLINTETTTDSQFNIQSKKALMQELV